MPSDYSLILVPMFSSILVTAVVLKIVTLDKHKLTEKVASSDWDLPPLKNEFFL